MKSLEGSRPCPLNEGRKVAVPAGFEPANTPVTGEGDRPLHDGTVGAESRVALVATCL